MVCSQLALLAAAGPALAQRGGRLEVWRDPNCGCWSGWVADRRTGRFAVEDRVVASIAPFLRMLGTPAALLSYHTAQVAGFALEGHVPALAIRRLLTDRPTGVVGLAVPAMPTGSPGMEVPGQPRHLRRYRLACLRHARPLHALRQCPTCLTTKKDRLRSARIVLGVTRHATIRRPSSFFVWRMSSGSGRMTGPSDHTDFSAIGSCSADPMVSAGRDLPEKTDGA